MRVAHLTSVHPRYDVRIFLKECRSLVADGHTVTLIVADGMGDESKSGILIRDVGKASGRLDRMLGVTQRILQSALKVDADLYHIHDPELLTICLALKRQGKKVVFDAHEDVPKQILGKHYLRPIFRKLISRLFAGYERYVCKRLDGVVAATPSIREKFTNINNKSIDINNFPLIGELDAHGMSVGSGTELCYVGGIARIRGIHEMVRALELTRTDVRLNLVGSFAEKGIENDLLGYVGWSKVTQWGELGRTGVRDVLARSVAGLVVLHPTPNYVESLPIKMFEYMSAGIPIIASDFPLWKEIVEQGGCGLCVPPLDLEKIAWAIDQIVDNPEMARRMGENGRRAVIEKYNWGVEEEKLRDFYRSMAGVLQ